MEKHYICEGECGGVSDTVGVCQAGGCSEHGTNLSECNCDDSNHKKVLENKDEDNNQ